MMQGYVSGSGSLGEGDGLLIGAGVKGLIGVIDAMILLGDESADEGAVVDGVGVVAADLKPGE